jgi:diphosphomevalonate decarboxylase
MPKASVTSPANIAFVKYWGARDLERALPMNPSISMTLSDCVSHCTIEVLDTEASHVPDEVWLAGTGGGFASPDAPFVDKVRRQLDRIRRWAGRGETLRVATRNSFPSAAGLASSASGFSALTLAAVHALGRGETSAAELSRLARESGSGSAARSVFGGYVEWPEAGADDGGKAVQVADASHWELCDVIAVVEIGPKTVSSRDGHRLATTSPHYPRRLELLPGRLAEVRQAIRDRDLDRLGPVLEEEAVDLHLIAMSSKPPIFYWSPGTLAVLRTVRELRQEGLSAWATMDAGANVHVICDPASEEAVAERLESLAAVGFVIRDGVGPGPDLSAPALF